MTQAFTRLATARRLFAAALMAGSCSAAYVQQASAQEVSKVEAKPAGVVSVRGLSDRAGLMQALGFANESKPLAMPMHRLPDGSLTSRPSARMLNELPSSPAPNSTVVASPNFASQIGFVGIHEGDNAANGFELEPPDHGLAVNNNVAAEVNNNVIQFFNATTGAALTAAIPTATFFALPSGYNVSDTQSFYDPVLQRWFIDEITWNGTFYGFAIAVSQTSNPLGSYWLYRVKAFSSAVSGCQGQDCFPDYPKAGFDKNGFYITTDLFSNVGGNFVESAIYAMPKAKLIAGAGFTYIRFDDPSDFVVQPSIPAPGQNFSAAANGSEFLMSAPGNGQVAVLAVTNTNNIVSNINSMLLRRVVINTQGYGSGTVPSTEPNVVGPYCKSQGVTSAPSLDGGYSAFQATAQYANGGSLYAALAFGSRDGTGLARDVLSWFHIKPTLTASSLTAIVVNQGVITPPDGYSLSYPAFGLSKTGAGLMAMTITNKSKTVVGGYPSAAIIQFTGAAPTGSIVVTGPGATSDDGFTGCPGAGPGQVGRWGDYGAAVVDAATGYYYAASEMIPRTTVAKRGKFANWGTFITQAH